MKLQSTLLTAMVTICLSGCSTNEEVSTSEVAQQSSALELTSIAKRAQRGFQISPVPTDTAGLSDEQITQVGYGSYLVNAQAVCGGCHSSPAGFLAGGNPFFLDAFGHIVWARNLTPDESTGLQLTEAQFIETMRTGRDFHEGETRMLVVMPWLYMRWQSDGDLKAIYAYLRAIPPASNAVPADTKSALPLPAFIPFPGRYTDGDVERPLPPGADPGNVHRGLAISPVAQPAIKGLTLREYGKGSYLANATMHCNECHTVPDRGGDLRINTAVQYTGGAVFAVPPPLQPVFRQVRSMSANLLGATNGFFNEPDDSYARFAALIHSGSHFDEDPARPLGFPMSLVAGNLGLLLDEDLLSLYTYFKHLPSISGAADGVRQDYARYCASGADCQSGESCFPDTHECIGKACSVDSDCDACQTCGGGQCQAPLATSACLLGAL